jgi:hypothetical protein
MDGPRPSHRRDDSGRRSGGGKQENALVLSRSLHSRSEARSHREPASSESLAYGSAVPRIVGFPADIHGRRVASHRVAPRVISLLILIFLRSPVNLFQIKYNNLIYFIYIIIFFYIINLYLCFLLNWVDQWAEDGVVCAIAGPALRRGRPEERVDDDRSPRESMDVPRIRRHLDRCPRARGRESPRGLAPRDIPLLVPVFLESLVI